MFAIDWSALSVQLSEIKHCELHYKTSINLLAQFHVISPCMFVNMQLANEGSQFLVQLPSTCIDIQTPCAKFKGQGFLVHVLKTNSSV